MTTTNPTQNHRAALAALHAAEAEIASAGAAIAPLNERLAATGKELAELRARTSMVDALRERRVQAAADAEINGTSADLASIDAEISKAQDEARAAAERIPVLERVITQLEAQVQEASRPLREIAPRMEELRWTAAIEYAEGPLMANVVAAFHAYRQTVIAYNAGILAANEVGRYGSAFPVRTGAPLPPFVGSRDAMVRHGVSETLNLNVEAETRQLVGRVRAEALPVPERMVAPPGRAA